MLNGYTLDQIRRSIKPDFEKCGKCEPPNLAVLEPPTRTPTLADRYLSKLANCAGLQKTLFMI